MANILLEFAILFLSSFLVLMFVYFKVSITSLLQIVLGAIIILIIFFDRVVLSSSNPFGNILRISLLFLISFSLQVLVYSTGGFYSPFLVLFHLFAIATSFLVNLKVAMGFLFFSISVLIAETILDLKLSVVFNNDYATVTLYIISFVVIIPLSRVIAARYHFKDALSKILTRELKLTQIRQESVLEGLSDIVLITGTDLKILSFNEAAQRILRLSSSELINSFLFEVLFLKDMKNNLVNGQYLNTEEIIDGGTIHIARDLLLFVRNTLMPRRVILKVRPTANLEGKIDQIAFIISETESQGEKDLIHQDLQEALLKHEAVLEDLKNKLIAKNMLDLSLKTELLGKAERDILTALELADHGLKPTIQLKDISAILSRIVSLESLFAKELGVNLQFIIDSKYIQEAKALVPAGSTFSASAITSPYFTAPIDAKWFDILMQKLLDMAILLASDNKFTQTQAFLTYDKEGVYISLTVNSTALVSGDDKLLLTEYYGKLGATTNLHLGSGLEGYMVKTVASLLGIPLIIKIIDKQRIEFTVKLSKKPHLTN